MHILHYLVECWPDSSTSIQQTDPLESFPANTKRIIKWDPNAKPTYATLWTFWAAISLPISVLLIELDRFLAIRFPFKVHFKYSLLKLEGHAPLN